MTFSDKDEGPVISLSEFYQNLNNLKEKSEINHHLILLLLLKKHDAILKSESTWLFHRIDRIYI